MATLLNKTTNRFSDLNILFTRHPVTGDVTVKQDVEAIKFSIKNLILTRFYERPFHPEIGSSVYNLLFENFRPDTVSVLQREVRLTIENFEPRAVVLAVEVEDYTDTNEIKIIITFTTQNLNEPITLDVILERTR